MRLGIKGQLFKEVSLCKCLNFTYIFIFIFYTISLFPLGDDNLCNVAHLLPCTPTKQSKKENSFPATSPRARTLLFGEHSGSKTPTKFSSLVQSPVQRSQETPTTMKCYSLKKERVRTQLFKPEGM